jgi:CRISPR-associated protein Csb2
MSSALLLTVRFHEGRYHGVPDWPPSPARLFQALVAGAANGSAFSEPDREALTWLERLDPPLIAAPTAQAGRTVTTYVPNNDLDAVGHDPRRIAEVKAAKSIRPQIFDAATPLLYVWRFSQSPAADAHTARLCAIAERLYQLGRGVDMAWAAGDVLTTDEANALIEAHRGPIHRPTLANKGSAMPCPGPGSLASLIARFQANSQRFSPILQPSPTPQDPYRTKQTGTAFAQPPKPRFRHVSYDCPPKVLLFDLTGLQVPWPQRRIVALTEMIRDAAAAKLRQSYEKAGRAHLAALVEPVFVGRGAENADKANRLRMIPLPSIGHPQAARSIKRLLVEVPPNCPIPSEEIAWAFSGLESSDPETGELTDLWRLAPAADDTMLRHYGAQPHPPSLVWRSVTPLALPVAAGRRRIDPQRMREDAKDGKERSAEEQCASAAIAAALRHAGITTPAEAVTVQREPYTSKGARAEAFASGTRFPKEQLWHTEIHFTSPVSGPLVLGDGRYLGLGVMSPEKEPPGVIALKIEEGLEDSAGYNLLTRALRRAVMALAQVKLGGKPLPKYFSGHEADGSAAGGGSHDHLAFAYDEACRALLIIPPHLLSRRSINKDDRAHFDLLRQAISELRVLRAGAAGILSLSPVTLPPSDRLLTQSTVWRSVTPYRLTRHVKGIGLANAIETDLRRETSLIKLPHATIEARPCASDHGVEANITLQFEVAVRGPILLGKTKHSGGGLFAAAI